VLPHELVVRDSTAVLGTKAAPRVKKA
jgi:hypothetical protein